MGPHRSSNDWLHGRLLLADEMLDLQTDPDDLAVVPDIKQDSARMRDRLSEFFPSADERTILFHLDLHAGNIMIDSDSRINAILDWEFAAAVPLWYAARLPKLLQVKNGTPWLPDKSRYAHEGQDEDDVFTEWLDGVTVAYREDLAEYEKKRTFIDLFLAEMQVLQPEWVRLYRQGGHRVEFEEVVVYIEAARRPRLPEWLESHEVSSAPIEKEADDDGNRTLVDGDDAVGGAKCSIGENDPTE